MNSSFFCVAAALFAAALEPILVKLGYRGAVTPLQLIVVKNLIAATIIFPLTRTCRLPSYKDALRIASVSVLLMITNTSSLYALSHLPAVTVITLTTSTPAIVALVNSALGRDSLSWRFWLGFCMCFSGVLMTIDVFHSANFACSDFYGLAAVVCCICSSTIYRVRMESLTNDYEPRLVSNWVFWINGAIALIFIAPFIEPIPRESLPLGIWIGIVAAVSNVAFLWAIKMVGSTNISIYNLIQRPIIILAAALILSEPLQWIQIIGIVLVFAGLPLARAQRLAKAA